ncbi:hydrolase [Paractinoplanes deccanensis]|uniref:Hydrolase n=1 Tax=Paractinoplanes deccanensis TaxID=113561 RepID=A0ABQ3Y373_9ACTN|nr:alpha/beta hydrolase [Actinoplanes deccanensis]GID74449.1 hydrolase [Actinoplanes deccanensis]
MTQTLTTYEIGVGGIAQRFHVAGRGPVCVMHPGGPGVDWSYLRMPLVEEFVTAVYVEPVGTGESGRLASHPHGYTVQAYVPFVHAVVQHVGAKFLLGHSHGGLVAQQYALTHPTRLAGMALYATAPCNGPDLDAVSGRNAERIGRRPRMGPVLQALHAPWPETDEGATANLRAILPLYFDDYWGHEARYAALREAVRCWHVSQDGEVFDVRDRLGRITTPALAIAGAHDWICEPSWSRRLAEGIPGSSYVEQPHSGHFGHIEEPEGFAAALEKWILASHG